MSKKMNNNRKLRVGTTMVSTEVNGPGRRLVLWLQGCEFHCDGCFNPEFWDVEAGRLMSGKSILTRARQAGTIEGLTFSGGEPFLQAAPLARLAQEAHREGLGVVCYTGYALEEIRAGQVEGGLELLGQVDLLIDGLFRKEQQAPLAWRGSGNQRLHFLTPRYRHLRAKAENDGRRQVEIIMGEDSLAVTGIFPVEFWQRLRRKIATKKE